MAQLRLKNTLLKVIPLIFIGVFFIFNTAWASLTTFDDFENYDIGQLRYQDDWEGSGQTSFQVEANDVYEGFRAIRSPVYGAVNWKQGEATTTNTINFYAKLPGCNDINISLISGPVQTQVIGTYIALSGGLCVATLYTSPPIVFSFASDYFNTWRKISIDYRNGNEARIKIGDEPYSDWETINYGSIDGILFYDWSAGQVIDDIILGTPIIGIEPILTPTTPPNCEKTVVDYSNISITGNVSIPKDNLNTYDLLIVNFEDLSATGTIKYLNIDLPNLIANQDFNYSATTTLPVLKGYRITYTLFGYDSDGKVISESFACPCLPPFWCFDTLISTEFPLAPELLIQYGEYAEATSETCTSTNLMERLICDIKNILQSLILPSQSKIGELKQNVGLIKQKFPMNYLMVASNFFSNVRSGVNSTSTISLKVFGQSGNLDFSIWDKTANIASTSQKFSDIFSGFFGLIFIGGFLTWAILFSKRIFK